jgi:hypothetical protein
MRANTGGLLLTVKCFIAGGPVTCHPSPRVQFSITLGGEVEVTTGDGERRRFGRGSVYLSADTTGEGHDTRVVSADPWLVAVVPLAEQSVRGRS